MENTEATKELVVLKDGFVGLQAMENRSPICSEKLLHAKFRSSELQCITCVLSTQQYTCNNFSYVADLNTTYVLVEFQVKFVHII